MINDILQLWYKLVFRGKDGA